MPFKRIKQRLGSNPDDTQDAREFELRQEDFSPVDNEHASIVRDTAPELFHIEADHVRVGDEYARTIFIVDYPPEIEDHWLKDIYRFEDPLDISLYIQPLDVQRTIKELGDRMARVEADIDEAARKQKANNPRKERLLHDLAELRQLIGTDGTKPFEFTVIITIRARDLAELNRITERIESKLGVRAKTRRATDRHADGFLAGLPVLKNEIASTQSVQKMHTQGLATFFPFVSSELNHGTGSLFGQNLVTGGSVIVNRFDQRRVSAWNMVIFGSTGVGKSVTAKIDAFWWIAQGAPAVFIDPNGEYEPLAAAFGGLSVTLAVDSPQKLNPLDFTYLVPDTAEELYALEKNPLREKIAFLLELLAVMIRSKEDGSAGVALSDLQMAVLERALRATYLKNSYDTERPQTLLGAKSRDMPTLSDLSFVLGKIVDVAPEVHVQEAADSLLNSLTRYTGSGALAGMFDNQSTVDLTAQRVVVFNIENLRDAQYAPVMHMVLEFLRSQMFTSEQRNSGQKRLLYVDEAHRLMRFPETAQFLADVASTARKYFVGFTLITQDADRLLLNPDGSANPRGIALMGQFQTVILMKQGNLKALKALQGTFALNDGESHQLTKIERGQALIMVEGRERAWVHMIGVLSPQMMDIITTNPEDRAAIHARQINQSGGALPPAARALPRAPQAGE